MMVCVDTSVWVAALRDESGPEADGLSRLLDDDTVAMPIPVRMELLAGMTQEHFIRYRRLLTALPMYFPTKQTWALVEVWLERAGQAGQRFGVVDLLIAAIAAERSAQLWSLDRDFGRMESLRFVRLHLPG